MRAKILFLAQLLPYPPICGGTIRSFNILKRLCANHDVTLLAFSRCPEDVENARYLRRYCVDAKTVPMARSGLLNARWAAQSLLGRSSFIIGRDHVSEMREEVNRTLAAEAFDLIYVDHLQMFQYVKGLEGQPRLLDEHNLEWRIIQRIATVKPHGPHKWFAALEWRKLRKYELAACAECDAVATVTEHDKSSLEAENPRLRNVACVPIGVDPAEFRAVDPEPESTTILSVATMSWPPNVDSIQHFCSDIYPLVKERVPEARLVIAGKRPPASIQRLEADPSISVPGFVNDIHEVARNSAVFIVPLRSGSGMRVKILNAMAMGLPVVSTSVGCEGIEVTHGKNALLADTAEEFARSVAQLLEDREKRFEIGAAGRKFVVENYSWEVIYPRLDWLVDSLIDRSRSQAAV
ncbi:MAG: glycosyltransferase family 4 protein [Armatimonadota bacterium]|nr:glycosyltransferase family 4 protein [Armatimonadota bacterium]